MQTAERSRGGRRLPLVAGFLALGGCFATRSDVRIVQGDVAALRTELVRNDLEHKEALAAAVRVLQAVGDSVARVNARTLAVQGDVRTETRAIKEQLLQLQTLLGQSAATIARLRATLEERASAPPVNPTAIGDSAATAAPTGPSVLYQNGLNLIRSGSTTTGRNMLNELINAYPKFENIIDAKYWVAVSYQTEKAYPAADAAYAGLVAEYPESSYAPTAVYKRALMFSAQGNAARAKELYLLVISRYPKSPEATFAAEQLKPR